MANPRRRLCEQRMKAARDPERILRWTERLRAARARAAMWESPSGVGGFRLVNGGGLPLSVFQALSEALKSGPLA